jgi:tRNA dimethylallyltransferase
MLDRPDAQRIKALDALGYRQARAVLEGKLGREQALLATQVATRHYAKRQLTWFRRDGDITWFEGFGDDPQVQRRVLETLSRSPVPAGRSRPEPSAVSPVL